MLAVRAAIPVRRAVRELAGAAALLVVLAAFGRAAALLVLEAGVALACRRVVAAVFDVRVIRAAVTAAETLRGLDARAVATDLVTLAAPLPSAA
jgi:hypothetical protein